MKKYAEAEAGIRAEVFNKLFDEVFTLASRKARKEVKVALGDLPSASIRAIFAYGCQRFINDKLGGSEISTEEAGEKFQAIVEILLSESGWQGRAPSAGKSSADPVEAEMQRMAREAIKAALKAKGIALKAVADKMPEFVSGYIEKNREALRKQAEVIVAARDAAPDLDMTLDL